VTSNQTSSNRPSTDALVEALPASLFVVDALGTISYATDAAAALVGRTPDELDGLPVLELVSPDTAWAYAAAIGMATDYPGSVMGPLRVTFIGGGNELQTADLWANNHLDNPEISGIVCMLTNQTAATRLGDAVASITDDSSAEVTALHVVNAMKGEPVVADAAVITRDEIGGFRLVAAADDLDPEVCSHFTEGPWSAAIDSGVHQFYGQTGDLPMPLSGTATRAGYSAVWIEPLPSGGSDGVLVTWRRRPGNPSPNQLRMVAQGAAIVSLAYRIELLVVPEPPDPGGSSQTEPHTADVRDPAADAADRRTPPSPPQRTPPS
jgi:hypothetical protein